MRQLREILRQKLLLKRSHRDVARSVGVSPGSVGSAVSRAKLVGLDWTAIESLADDALDERLYGSRGGARDDRAMPDPQAIHRELRRAGVTLQLLHVEYLQEHPDGYRYTKFCDVYREWLARRSPTMRQVHVAGEKCFVDFSGKKPHIVDAETGELVEVELFVGVLGASNLTFARAVRTQQIRDWIDCHVRMFALFGGVAGAVVPDQLRTGVTKPCRYEPEVQRTYEELAQHYGTAILPARAAHPRDKAKVEVAVQIAQRWILARLRNQTFFSIAELNARIAELTADLNARTMRTYGASRAQLFERYERAALRPLPAEPYECAEWKWPKVNIDYHVEFDHHYYSVEHTLLHEQVEVRATVAVVEIYVNGLRHCSHARSYKRGGFTTKPEHMPVAHRAHAEWSPSRLISWGATIGPSTASLIEKILEGRPHPEHGYRSCLGILRLSKRYGHDRLEVAAARALAVGARSYRHVDSILKHGLDRDSREEAPTTIPRPAHKNVRGRDYYH
jgi:transposase